MNTYPRIVHLTAKIDDPQYLVVSPGTLFKTDQVRFCNGVPCVLADVFEGSEQLIVRISAYSIDNLPDNILVTSQDVFGAHYLLNDDGSLDMTAIVYHLENVEGHLLSSTDNILNLTSTDLYDDPMVWKEEVNLDI